MSEDDESWFSEDELEQSSAVEVDAIAIDGLVRGHDTSLWSAHLRQPALSLRRLPEPALARGAGEPTQFSGWGLGAAGVALGALGPGAVVLLTGRHGRALQAAQALALQLADALALAGHRALHGPPDHSARITPTMLLCGAGPHAAMLALLARCGVASMAELVGPGRAAHDAPVRAALEGLEGIAEMMRQVRNDEILRGQALFTSVTPRLSAFVRHIRSQARERKHPSGSVIPALVLTQPSAWLGTGESDPLALLRTLAGMVRSAGAIGIVAMPPLSGAHDLAHASFEVEGSTLALVHHRAHWPNADRFHLEYEPARARVTVGETRSSD